MEERKEDVEPSLDAYQNGLSFEEATYRLVRDGKNVIQGKKKISALVRFLFQFGNIMVIILIISAGVSITLGLLEKSNSEVIDGVVIFAIVLFNAFFGFIQENKAIASIESLKKLSGSTALVRRSGEVVRIKSEDVVVGDTMILESGMVLCADIVLIQSHSLMMNESALTGESVPVSKNYKKIPNEQAGIGEKVNQAFCGTVVSYGRGEGIVTACGNNTQIGKIATMVQNETDERTPLEKSIESVGKIITYIVLFIAALIFVIEVLRPNSHIIDALMTAVAISVAAIPESLPAVITIIMSLGVTRLAKKKAIVKKLHAVETLGCCDVICSDKTGTLTENVMTVKEIFVSMVTKKDVFERTPDFEVLLKTMCLCNDSEKTKKGYVGDPTETALVEFADLQGFLKSSLDKTNKRVGEIPFESNRKLMTTLNFDNEKYIQYTKGGVDEVLKRCSQILINGTVVPLTEEHIMEIKKTNNEFASRALRVLAYATKELFGELLEPEEKELTFVGLSGMIDPPRKEVAEAVKKCVRAGMRAIMITGDHRHTAFAIAKEVGIATKEEEVITGEELDKLSEEEFIQKIKDIRVFARVSPNHKVLIVKAFKTLGKTVVMTGDGVNDAPSIKAASIGVGMGITGTDITKEAADIVVTDDNFATIVVAIEEGRKIYRNIQKAIKYLFTTNFAEIFSLFIATLIFPEYLLLLPLQILFINLLTDSLPAIALGVEAPESNLMNEKPRLANKNLFYGGVGSGIIIQGLFQTFLILSVFIVGLIISSPQVASTMVFYSLNIIQILHMFSVRTYGCPFASNPFKNKLIIWAVLVDVVSVLALIFTPLGQIFKLVPLFANQWLFVIVLSVLILPLNELYRVARKRKLKKKKS
ncbi:MAG: cation-translocating P-type ATPase [Clostridia bacterium]